MKKVVYNSKIVIIIYSTNRTKLTLLIEMMVIVI